MIFFGILLIALVIGLFHFFPQINYRPMPEKLTDANLNEQKPNWVSSLVAQENSHYIAPLSINNLSSIRDCLLNSAEKVTIVSQDLHALIAFRQSKVFNFTDWLVIYSNGQLTASATLGYYDFGKNRQWIEQIRKTCSQNKAVL